MRHVKHLLITMLIILIMASCFMSVAAMAAGTDDIDTASDTADGYSLTVVEDTVTVEEDETPLAGVPTVAEACCILHAFLMIGALAVAVYYTHDQKMGQKREFELRRELSR